MATFDWSERSGQDNSWPSNKNAPFLAMKQGMIGCIICITEEVARRYDEIFRQCAFAGCLTRLLPCPRVVRKKEMFIDVHAVAWFIITDKKSSTSSKRSSPLLVQGVENRKEKKTQQI